MGGVVYEHIYAHSDGFALTGAGKAVRHECDPRGKHVLAWFAKHPTTRVVVDLIQSSIELCLGLLLLSPFLCTTLHRKAGTKEPDGGTEAVVGTQLFASGHALACDGRPAVCSPRAFWVLIFFYETAS